MTACPSLRHPLLVPHDEAAASVVDACNRVWSAGFRNRRPDSSSGPRWPTGSCANLTAEDGCAFSCTGRGAGRSILGGLAFWGAGSARDKNGNCGEGKIVELEERDVL